MASNSGEVAVFKVPLNASTKRIKKSNKESSKENTRSKRLKMTKVYSHSMQNIFEKKESKTSSNWNGTSICSNEEQNQLITSPNKENQNPNIVNNLSRSIGFGDDCSTSPSTSIQNDFSKLSLTSSAEIFGPPPTDTVSPIIDLPKPKLPVLEGTSTPDLHCINPETLVTLISTQNFPFYQRYCIIDCRFPYEYEGGHIRGAINLEKIEQMEDFFLENEELLQLGSNLCIIFHCEFSSHRGPKMARHLRNLDRKMNRYPNLTYPEVYLLEGGYRKFFETNKLFCVPQQYVEMKDPKYSCQLKEAMKEHMRNIRRHRSRSCSELDFSRSSKSKSMLNRSDMESAGEDRVPFTARERLALSEGDQVTGLNFTDREVTSPQKSNSLYGNGIASQSCGSLDFSHRSSANNSHQNQQINSTRNQWYNQKRASQPAPFSPPAAAGNSIPLLNFDCLSPPPKQQQQNQLQQQYIFPTISQNYTVTSPTQNMLDCSNDMDMDVDDSPSSFNQQPQHSLYKNLF